MKRTLITACLIAGLLALGWFTADTRGWFGPGHEKVTEAAVHISDGTLPDFFTKGLKTTAHVSADPDLYRELGGKALGSAEGPEHYFDLELIGDYELPATRFEFLEWCYTNKISPKKAGLAPYAVVEWTERLKVAFAEHRRWPDNPHIHAKCLYIAGMLAHYAADVSQPLHCTIHYNGRVGEDGKSPGTGIHFRMDALLELTAMSAKDAAKATKAEVIDDVLKHTMKFIRANNGMVDKVYAMEKELPKVKPGVPPTATLSKQADALARERLEASAQFVASLYLTAWEQSKDVKLPGWLRR